MLPFRLLLLPAVLLLGACTTLGPRAIEGSRTDYNVALARTESEQLLLNLVRLRYRDQVLFLEASALNTQFTFVAGAEASRNRGDEIDLYGLIGRVAVEETPTVTYAPLQGSDFVERVLSPIALETLLLLDQSGWSIERLFRATLQSANALPNAPAAAGPTPEQVPEYADFARMARLLRELELRGLLSSARTADGLALRFTPAASKDAALEALAALLELDPTRTAYRLSTDSGAMDGTSLTLQTRSFAGVMYFLSQGVEVPEADRELGRVTLTRDAAGREFDWLQVTDGLMHVRSSRDRPANAAVAVRYRGHWFYVDDSDLDSKSTFSMLGQLFALQSGNAQGQSPLLTIPVGG